ncbi:hypothetical protein ACO0RG_000084 [Hanseniaspora osmophila]|uniref:UPF0160 protein n=1 Tax=Hanseniaspora osmophila TaxID=56408 RepID=A0A1E5R4M9_9ASCO|nr:UPF0160 protein [Hanseniaspora osmophila]
MSLGEPIAKKVKVSEQNHPMNAVKKIVTHSGSFHADEALAVYMLRLLPTYQTAIVVRSRDPKVWETADIIVDVCGEYDPSQNKFDHHQRTFNEYFNESKKTTKLSSAGLIYKHFGHEIISEILSSSPVNDKDLETLYVKIYDDFVESIDANDNGVSSYPKDYDLPFKTGKLSLPGVISSMNPVWNDEDQSSEKFDTNFQMASQFIGDIFKRYVYNTGASWLPAKNFVVEAVSKRDELDPSRGAIIEFSRFVPWKEHLYEVEKELGIEGQIKFVLFPDSNKSYRVSTVSVAPGSFDFRLGLPEALRGLRDDELSVKSGIEGGVFVHASGFIGGFKTREGALKLAQQSFN